ncbi:hypothetical protein HWI79_718 [Cryptosporidium felis]|nr:hypothetical protein HWI79_718 [Cryptosporidium felis]
MDESTTAFKSHNLPDPISRTNIDLYSKRVFSNTEKYNIWELFTNDLLQPKHYPSASEADEEIRSIQDLIRVFEHWKSQLSNDKISLVDFCRIIERNTLQSDIQDYRVNLIQRYKRLINEIEESKTNLPNFEVESSNADASNELNDPDIISSASSMQTNSISSEVENKLKLRKEFALKKRKLLLNEQSP